MLHSPFKCLRYLDISITWSTEKLINGDVIPASTHYAFDAYEKSGRKTPRVLIFLICFMEARD
jgi:hypothetical protein